MTSNSINSNASSKEEVLARLKELGIQFGEPEGTYWMFIEANYQRYTRKIADKYWTLPKANHGTSQIHPGDKALIYISARDGNRYNRSFVGVMTIASLFSPDDKRTPQIIKEHGDDDQDHSPSKVYIADIKDEKKYKYNLTLDQARKYLPTFKGKSDAKIASLLRRTPLRISEQDFLLADQFGHTGKISI